MITLKISFLLAIDLTEEQVRPTKNSSKKKNQKKPPNPKSTKTKEKAKKKTKEFSKKQKNPNPQNEEDSPYSVIQVENPISYIHIDYDLLPKKFKYSVDVICWGQVAKIFTKDGSKCLKTVIRENIAWVPIFLEHYLNPLPTEEIRKLLTQVVSLQIKMGKNSVGGKAKSDKSSVFYIMKDKENEFFFPEVFSEKPKQGSIKIVERLLTHLLYFPSNEHITTWIYEMNEVHSYKVATIVTKRSGGEDIHCKDFHEEVGNKSVKNKKKEKQKRQRTGSKKENIKDSEETKKMNYNIPAHVLLSDPSLTTFQIKDTGVRLKEVYALLSSDNMLTYEQKKELLPLVVKIRKINNLPQDILSQNEFKKVYATCTIPGVAQFKTAIRPLGTTLQFDESRFIITTDYPHINILELLQTRLAFVEIIGVKEPVKINTYQVDDKKSKKKNKNKTGPEALNEITTSIENRLAVALFDLSFLSQNFHLFKEKGQCYNPRWTPLGKVPSLDEYFMDRYTTYEINFCKIGMLDTHSPLTDSLLVDKGTMLKFEAHFLTPVHPQFYIRNGDKPLKRLLIILLDEEIAKYLLAYIITYNTGLTGSSSFLTPAFLFKKRQDAGDTDNVLSGFFLDDGNSFILFIEGPATGYILTILHEVINFNYSTAKVFYNSEYLFEERLYTTFYVYRGGIFVITLKLPLTEIFHQEKMYIEGNVPIHCAKAMQKLHLLLHSSSFKSILNHNLLPTEIELLSFSREYGHQLRYKDVDLGIDYFRMKFKDEMDFKLI